MTDMTGNKKGRKMKAGLRDSRGVLLPTAEQLKRYSAKDREKRAAQTPEQRESERAKAREKYALNREKRREAGRERKKRRLAAMTPEQRDRYNVYQRDSMRKTRLKYYAAGLTAHGKPRESQKSLVKSVLAQLDAANKTKGK